MHKLKQVVTIAGVAALLGAAHPVFAEAAPVFDVDTFESGNDQQDQDLVMPPAPGEEAAAAKSQAEPAQPMAVGAGSGSDAGETFVRDETPKPAPQSVGVTRGNDAVSTQPTQSAGVSVDTEHLSPEERMRRLEQQLASMQDGQNGAQVQSMQTEIQSLRGQIETLTHELDTMRAKEKAGAAQAKATQSVAAVGKPDPSVLENSDSPNDAVAATTGAAGAVAVKKSTAKKKPHASETDELSGTKAVASSGKDQPNVAEEQQIYQTAYDLIKAKKYNEAVTALQGMLKKYPSGQFASNAHYWLGELYGLMSKHDNALEEFNIVITKFPDSPRVSDAELKVGLILAAQSKWADAKKAFKKVINTYPGTASARLASEQLKQIKLAGH